MNRIRACLLLIITLLPTTFVSAEDFPQDPQILIEQVLTHRALLVRDRDAATFIHALTLLQKGKQQELIKFLNYQLDAISCAAWSKKELMQTREITITRRYLQKIKEFRQTYPRPDYLDLQPERFSPYYGPLNRSYAQCADQILAEQEQ